MRSGALGREVTGSMRLVLLVLAGYADPRTRQAWPSLDTLAEATGLARGTVRVALNALETQGFLTVDRGIGRASSRYTLTTSWVSERPTTDSRSTTDLQAPVVGQSASRSRSIEGRSRSIEGRSRSTTDPDLRSVDHEIDLTRARERAGGAPRRESESETESESEASRQAREAAIQAFQAELKKPAALRLARRAR